MIDDLVDTAWRLLSEPADKPTQAAIKRAGSTAYYALFHMLAQANADGLAGSAGNSSWHRVYRALNHSEAKRALARLRLSDSAHAAVEFAQAFVELQDRRHDADYDPASHFMLADAAALVAQARIAIAAYRDLPVEVHKDLATQILFKIRT